MITFPQLPQLPTVDVTRLDAAKAVDTVTNVLRDGAYITIGLGVLGAQQAAELTKQYAGKVQHASEQARTATESFTTRYTAKVHQAGEQARTATETLTKQVRGLVGSAA
jgi:hypothetical protein